MSLKEEVICAILTLVLGVGIVYAGKYFNIAWYWYIVGGLVLLGLSRLIKEEEN